jgi:hypothetical protein
LVTATDLELQLQSETRIQNLAPGPDNSAGSQAL